MGIKRNKSKRKSNNKVYRRRRSQIKKRSIQQRIKRRVSRKTKRKRLRKTKRRNSRRRTKRLSKKKIRRSLSKRKTIFGVDRKIQEKNIYGGSVELEKDPAAGTEATQTLRDALNRIMLEKDLPPNDKDKLTTIVKKIFENISGGKMGEKWPEGGYKIPVEVYEEPVKVYKNPYEEQELYLLQKEVAKITTIGGEKNLYKACGEHNDNKLLKQLCEKELDFSQKDIMKDTNTKEEGEFSSKDFEKVREVLSAVEESTTSEEYPEKLREVPSAVEESTTWKKYLEKLTDEEKVVVDNYLKGGGNNVQKGGVDDDEDVILSMVKQLQYAEYIWKGEEYEGNQYYKNLSDDAIIYIYSVGQNQDDFIKTYLDFKNNDFKNVAQLKAQLEAKGLSTEGQRLRMPEPELKAVLKERLAEHGRAEVNEHLKEGLNSWEDYINFRRDKFAKLRLRLIAPTPVLEVPSTVKYLTNIVKKSGLEALMQTMQGESIVLITRVMSPMFIDIAPETIKTNIIQNRRWNCSDSIINNIEELIDNADYGNWRPKKQRQGGEDHPEYFESNWDCGDMPPSYHELEKVPHRINGDEEPELKKVHLCAARLWSIELYGIYGTITKIHRTINICEEQGNLFDNQFSMFTRYLEEFIKKCSHYIPLDLFNSDLRDAFNNIREVSHRFMSQDDNNDILRQNIEDAKRLLYTEAQDNKSLFRGECRIFNREYIGGNGNFISDNEALKGENGTGTLSRTLSELLNSPQPTNDVVLKSFTATTPDLATAINFTSQAWCTGNNTDKLIKVIYIYNNITEENCGYLGYFGIPTEHEVLIKPCVRLTVTDRVISYYDPTGNGDIRSNFKKYEENHNGDHNNIYLLIYCRLN